jgi:hypothetical protein
MPESGKMFKMESKNMTAHAYNLIVIQIDRDPDLLIGFHKCGNVKGKLPDIKPTEESKLLKTIFLCCWVRYI